MLPMACSLFLPKIWLPFLALAEVYVLVSLRKAAIASTVSNFDTYWRAFAGCTLSSEVPYIISSGHARWSERSMADDER